MDHGSVINYSGTRTGSYPPSRYHFEKLIPNKDEVGGGLKKNAMAMTRFFEGAEKGPPFLSKFPIVSGQG